MTEPTPEELAAIRDAEVFDAPPPAKLAKRAPAQGMMRLLPQDPEAELGVLSSFYLSPVELGAMCAAKGITPRHFHIPAHAEVFDVMIDLHARMQPVDFLLICNSLRARGKFDAVGGAGFISSISTYLPTATNAEYYIGLLQQKFTAREVVRIATAAASRAYEAMEGEELAALVHDLHSDVGALIYKPTTRTTIREDLDEIYREVSEGQDDAALLKTGMRGIDEFVSLYRGDLLIITGPTSSGKSVLGAQLALHMAEQRIVPKDPAKMDRPARVAFFPLEMKSKATLKRALAQMANGQFQHHPDFIRKAIQNNQQPVLFDTEIPKWLAELKATSDYIASLDIHMRDDLFYWEDIEADIRAEHAKRPFDMICIDHLGLLETRKRFERDQLRVAYLSRSLKQTAKALDALMSVPCQESGDDGGELKSRGAKEVTFDANSLLRITTQTDSETGRIRPAGVQSWKQREGERGTHLPLAYNARLVRWEYSPREE